MKSPFLLALLFVLAVVGCRSPANPDQISQNQAVQLARRELSFVPESQEVEKVVEDGRALWRVTFRSKPLRPGRPMVNILIVSLDRQTGAVVGLSRN